MLTQVTSCAVVGLEGALVQVEVDVSNGGPYFSIVGLPDAAVQEARERVRSALTSSPCPPAAGTPLPLSRFSGEGEGGRGVGVRALVMASGGADTDLDGAMVVGELSLDGAPLESVRGPKSGYRRVAIYWQRAAPQRRVRHTNGILPMVSVARQRGLKRVYVPARDAPEAALVDGLEVYPVPNLAAMLDHLNGASKLARFEMPPMPKDEEVVYPVDMADVAPLGCERRPDYGVHPPAEAGQASERQRRGAGARMPRRTPKACALAAGGWRWPRPARTTC